jgi:hypothetical protein
MHTSWYEHVSEGFALIPACREATVPDLVRSHTAPLPYPLPAAAAIPPVEPIVNHMTHHHFKHSARSPL